MRAQFNFHARTGLQPGFMPEVAWYGIGVVFIVRLWWSAFTLTIMKKAVDQKTV